MYRCMTDPGYLNLMTGFLYHAQIGRIASFKTGKSKSLLLEEAVVLVYYLSWIYLDIPTWSHKFWKI